MRLSMFNENPGILFLMRMVGVVGGGLDIGTHWSPLLFFRVCAWLALWNERSQSAYVSDRKRS